MYSALIVAAGQGMRSGLPYNKNLHPLKGKPMILYSVEAFQGDPDCLELIVVTSKHDIEAFKDILPPAIKIAEGGATRQESVRLGLELVTSDYVMIHDGARPNLKRFAIEDIKGALPGSDAVTLAVKVKDTLRICRKNQIEDDIDRDHAYLLQTPQAFRTEAIKQAHQLAATAKHQYSDDTSVYRNELDKPAYIVQGYDENLKATTLTDMKILEELI